MKTNATATLWHPIFHQPKQSLSLKEYTGPLGLPSGSEQVCMTVMGFSLLGQDFFHIVPCVWFHLLLFEREEWIIVTEWGVCRLHDTNLEFRIQCTVSPGALCTSKDNRVSRPPSQSHIFWRSGKFLFTPSVDSSLCTKIRLPLIIHRKWSLYFTVPIILQPRGGMK